MYELGLHTQLTIWTFSKLVESIFPSLHDMITEKLQVSADFYASSWFITLFSADLDLYSSIRVMDLFIAKGPKSLYRFGLACLQSQKSALLELGNATEDPADCLKALRTVAVTAVAETGIEGLVLSSLTDFKFVNNRLIADVQTAGKIHGGAKLMFVTDRDSKRRSWVIAPPSDSSPNVGSNGPSDHSPSGRGAFENEWNKDADSLRRNNKMLEDSKGDGKRNRVISFLSKLKAKKSREMIEEVRSPSSPIGSPSARENGDLLKQSPGSPVASSGGGRRHRRRKNRSSESSNGVNNAFKSFRKKLGSIIPVASGGGHSTRGYARTEDGL
jgi:hypothetical protein